MDYYTPLEHRKQSYKEFMEEWIVAEFLRLIEDYGLKRPWYWEEFIAGLETWHHSLHLGLWFWRPTVWWKPQAGVSKAERAWLQEKYPLWEEQWGPIWDTVIQNINAGNLAETLPRHCPGSAICAICQSAPQVPALPRSTPCAAIRSRTMATPITSARGPVARSGGRTRICYTQKTVVERLLAGEIQPPDFDGILAWMGLTPEVMGDDAHEDVLGSRSTREAARAAGGSPCLTRSLSQSMRFGDDFVTQLVFVLETDTMREVAAKVAQHVVGKRQPARMRA